MIVASSFSSIFDDHKSLRIDHEHAPQAQTTFLNTGLSSVMPPRRRGIRLEREPFTGKYITQWKPDHSM